jgi:hypothetical protein
VIDVDAELGHVSAIVGGCDEFSRIGSLAR